VSFSPALPRRLFTTRLQQTIHRDRTRKYLRRRFIGDTELIALRMMAELTMLQIASLTSCRPPTTPFMAHRLAPARQLLYAEETEQCASSDPMRHCSLRLSPT